MVDALEEAIYALLGEGMLEIVEHGACTSCWQEGRVYQPTFGPSQGPRCADCFRKQVKDATS